MRGSWLRNKFEQKIADQLKKARIPYEYERTRLPFTITGWYVPDFSIPGPIFIETKGYLRPETKRKMVGVKQVNPRADIRFIFMGGRALNKEEATVDGLRSMGLDLRLIQFPRNG